jgi:integrase/recombinase XerD
MDNLTAKNAYDVILDDFLIYIGSEKGHSPHTLEAYKRDISSFFSFLVKSSVLSIHDVQEEHITNYLAQLRGEYADSSIARNFVAIKVLCRFLKREAVLKVNIAHTLDTPKVWQLIPEVLTSNEIEKLLNAPDTTTMLGARDKAIIETLYGSGLRVSEICSLKINDVDDTYLKVMGKGRKERTVPVGKKAIEAIDFYLANYRSLSDSEKVKELFVSERGSPMDRVAIWKMIKKYAKESCIIKNISPHTLRHSFATHLLDNGAELRVIQEMLGHASINSTDRYTHISNKHLTQSFEAFHPRK